MAAGVLNADMSQVAGWLRAAVRWWIEELRGLVPASLRRGGEPVRLLTPAAGEDWRLLRRGERVSIEDAAVRRLAVTVVAPAGTVLTRILAMPALPAADLTRMLALDLDRLTPLRIDEALFDWEVLAREPERERVELLLGVMRRTEAERLHNEAIGLGLRPARIALAQPDGRLSFDFAYSLAGEAPLLRNRRRWWTAVALLFALDLAILIGRDKIGTDRLEAAVDAAAPTAAAARLLQGRLVKQRRDTAQAIAARDRHEPLRVISAVSAVLPEGAWTQRLAWDGRTVRIAGYKDRGLDVLAALRRSPLLRDVRESDGDAASQTVAAQPYDVSAAVVPPR